MPTFGLSPSFREDPHHFGGGVRPRPRLLVNAIGPVRAARLLTGRSKPTLLVLMLGMASLRVPTGEAEMTTDFEERERIFEAMFTYGETLLFRIRARRDRLAGVWAAQMMGLPSDQADVYAATIVEGGRKGPGGRNLPAQILADLRQRGIELSEHRLHKQLDRLLEEARRQVMTE